MATLDPFTPGGSASLSASSSSSRVAIPKAASQQVVVYNSGTVAVYVALGDAGAVATTGSYPILAGSKEAITFGTATNLAAITASSTATLIITAGDGFVDGFGGGGSSSGGGGGATGTMYAGQQAVTASAVALPTQALVNSLTIKAKGTNTGTVFIGTATVNATDNGSGTGFALFPGEQVTVPVNNANLVYIIGTASDVVYFTGN